MRKHFLLLFLSILMTTLLTAQTYPKYPSYRAKVDKKIGHYHRTTKSALKNKKYRQAAINALMGLNATTKQKQFDKIDILVKTAYPLATEKSMQTIQELQDLAATSDVDKKAALLYEVVRVYDELTYLQNILNDVSDKTSLSSSDAYEVSMEKAQQSLEVAETEAAAFHYQNAMVLANNDHWKHRLGKARALKVAHHYNRNYQDVQQQYTIAKKTGQIVLGVNYIKNTSDHRVNDDHELLAVSEINALLSKRKYDFIRLAAQGEPADIIVDMTLTQAEIGRPEKSAYEDDKINVIDKEKEIVARAKYITYENNVYASLSYQYTLTDAKTGQQLTTESNRINNINVFQDHWYKVTGDRRALSKSELKRVQEDYSPEQIPVSQKLLSIALNSLRDQLAGHVINFTHPYGY